MMRKVILSVIIILALTGGFLLFSYESNKVDFRISFCDELENHVVINATNRLGTEIQSGSIILRLYGLPPYERYTLGSFFDFDGNTLEEIAFSVPLGICTGTFSVEYFVELDGFKETQFSRFLRSAPPVNLIVTGRDVNISSIDEI